jgi:hypothetical protein
LLADGALSFEFRYEGRLATNPKNLIDGQAEVGADLSVQSVGTPEIYEDHLDHRSLETCQFLSHTGNVPMVTRRKR